MIDPVAVRARAQSLWIAFAFILAVALAALPAGCGGRGGGETPGEPEVTFDGLHRVYEARVARLWVRPGATLEGKTKIQPSFEGLSYARPPSNRKDNFAIGERAMEKLEENLHDVFLEELARGNDWEIVDAPGPDVLRIRAWLIDVVFRNPPEGRNRRYSASAGDATLVLEIYDSETRQILARVADRRTAQRRGGDMMRAAAIDNRIAVRQMFQYWARRLRTGLDEVRERGTFEP